MLQTLVLKREPKQELNDLHQDAANHLGYPLNLYKCFQKYDIRPFTQESIDNYKYYTTDFINVIANVGFVTTIVMAWIAAAHIVVLCGWTVLSYFKPEFTNLLANQFVAMGALAFAALALTALGISAYCDRYRNWTKVRYNDYAYQIPEFVLQTAIDIKKDLPDANLYIDQLTVANFTVDPFLVVNYKQKDYYVEVWNEPKYKQKRTI